MRFIRIFSITVIVLAALLCVFAPLIATNDYAYQDREAADVRPSHHFLLGTDELGRDRFSRLVYGSRVSLTLAPAAAAISVVMALLVGGLGGYLGGWFGSAANALTDLFLSMPWLFLLLTVRAIMPLNISPMASVSLTFALLGLLGWASAARVLSAGAAQLRGSAHILQARAAGVRPARLFLTHVTPNLFPILLAQFWISVPLFILAEANLGLLGLGINEPLPSWGGMLRELENYSAATAEPWRFVSLALLVLVVSAFQFVLPETSIDERC